MNVWVVEIWAEYCPLYMVPRPVKVVSPDATDIPAPQRARTRLLDLRSSWNSAMSVLAGSTGILGYSSMAGSFELRNDLMLNGLLGSKN